MDLDLHVDTATNSLWRLRNNCIFCCFDTQDLADPEDTVLSRAIYPIPRVQETCYKYLLNDWLEIILLN